MIAVNTQRAIDVSLGRVIFIPPKVADPVSSAPHDLKVMSVERRVVALYAQARKSG